MVQYLSKDISLGSPVIKNPAVSTKELDNIKLRLARIRY